MSNTERIIRATTSVTVITLLVKGLGFVEKLLLAYFFGTGIQVDAYLVAYSLVFSAYVVLREVVRASFVPTLMRTWRTSLQDGWQLISITGTLLGVLLAGATVAVLSTAPSLVSLIAPGFTGDQRALAVRLTRLVILALLPLGLSTLTTATLHAQKRFNLPAFSDASFRAGPLVLLVAVGGIQATAVGAVAGALGKLAIEMLGLRPQMRTHLRRLRLSFNLSFPPVRTVGRLAAPLLAGLFFSLFIGPLVENAFASTEGAGGVSALTFARKIVETLAAILPFALGLVLLPYSAEMAAKQDQRELATTLTGAVRALTLLYLPLTVGLLVLRQPFVQLLFERGAFTAASTQLTAGVLLFYAFALLPFALEVIVVQFHFARQDTLTPVIADIVTFALNVALIPPLMAGFGLGGIALAAAIAKAVKVLALLLLFGWKVPTFRLAHLGPFTVQMALASLAAAAALLGLQALERSLGLGNPAALVVYLLSAAVVGGCVFLGTAYLLKVEEVRGLWHRGRAWCKAWVGGSHRT